MEPVRHDGRQEITALQSQPAVARKRRNWKKYLYAVLLLLPLLLFTIGFFVVPMLYILYLSFIDTEGLGGANAVYSIGNYVRFFTDPYYLHSLWLTIKVSLYTVIVSLLLGYPVALTMAKCSPRVRGLLALLVASPLLISIVVRNFGWYLLLLPNGTVNQLVSGLGITHSPLKLLFSEAGVVIGLSNAYLPFMILSIATSLYNIDPSLEKAGAILGASPFRSFVSITLPLSLPGIVSGIVLVFSMSMSAYVTPALMGGANVPMLPVVAYDQIIHLLRWTYGSAVSYVLLGITLASVTIFTRIMERGRYREVFR
ncbi:ABC transporter permease [Effusibacillus pohliae]|uniref:ABC transporter permease n=1 Tax=Effusibacillus pohliae TaxID=232270 RepID=UPI000378AE68|nr:ABC transporter permease [Effusibacillus pohliae]